MRAHEWQLAREHSALSGRASDALRARVARINRTGSTTKLDLRSENSSRSIDVEIDEAQWKILQLQTGDTVYAAPT